MLKGTISSNGMSLGRFLAFILAARAYGKNGNMDDVLKEMDKIQKIFGKGQTLGFVKQVLEEVNHIRYNPGAFIRQLRDYGLVDKDDKPIKEYYDEILYGSLDTFMMDSNYDKFKQLSNHCFNQWFDNHFKKNGHYIDPSFVYHYMLLRLAEMDTDLSTFVVTDCGFAMGGSLTAVTVIDMVAELLSIVPSLAIKLKLSVPL